MPEQDLMIKVKLRRPLTIDYPPYAPLDLDAGDVISLPMRVYHRYRLHGLDQSTEGMPIFNIWDQKAPVTKRLKIKEK